MKLFSFLILATILCGCTARPYSKHPHNDKAFSYIDAAHRELRQNSIYLYTWMEPHETFIGEDGFQNIYVMLGTKVTTVQEARHYVFYIIDTFFKRINQDTSLRPYLKEFPLDWKNLTFSLFFFDTSKKPYIGDAITRVDSDEKRLRYSQYNPVINNYVLIGQEPIEEAYMLNLKEKNNA